MTRVRCVSAGAMAGAVSQREGYSKGDSPVTDNLPDCTVWWRVAYFLIPATAWTLDRLWSPIPKEIWALVLSVLALVVLVRERILATMIGALSNRLKEQTEQGALQVRNARHSIADTLAAVDLEVETCLRLANAGKVQELCNELVSLRHGLEELRAHQGL